jgi:hypothetical protein
MQKSNQTSANEKTRFSFVCSFVNKRQTCNTNEKTTHDLILTKSYGTSYKILLNFLTKSWLFLGGS